MKKLISIGLTYYKKYKETLNYLIFGVLATILNIGVFAILNKVCGLDWDISNVIAIIVAVLFQYFTNKFLVFEYEKKNAKDTIIEFVKFMSCRLVTAIIDMVMMKIGIEKLKIPEIIMKIITNVVVIILNYIFSKFLVFAKKKDKKQVEDSTNN